MSDFIVTTAYGRKNHAGSKAPADILHYLESQGFIPLNISNVNTLKYLLHPFNFARIRRTVKEGDRVLFQYPSYSSSISKLISRLLDDFRKRGVFSVAIVHDVDFLRHFGRLTKEEEIRRLNQFDALVVHSESMREALKSGGCTVEHFAILGLFSYRVSRQCPLQQSSSRDTVVFAGNLSKSAFVPYLDRLCGEDLNFNMYGVGQEALPQSPFIRYKGKFSADDLSGISGGWGLVWDGDSIQACKGYMGQYLRYNSPHKASLYLCCGLPLIVPEGSAVAELVRAGNCGIVLSSLEDIRTVLKSVGASEYEEMKRNAAVFGQELMSGGRLFEALASFESE